MILSGREIARSVREGHIVLDPFESELLNPNSYNYRLGSTLLVSDAPVFDSKHTPIWEEVKIGGEGFLLEPGSLYLAHTMEVIGSPCYAMSLIGRSSLGRLGVFLQVTADLGHTGSVHQWTLELHVVQPVRVYSGMRIGQVSFWATEGAVVGYKGAYGSCGEPAPNIAGKLSPPSTQADQHGLNSPKSWSPT